MAEFEQGRTGRIVYTRIAPNEDLIQTVEKLCLQHHLANALVRGSLGSLSQASLDHGGFEPFEVAGPAIELLTVSGEIRTDANGVPHATLFGNVADPLGQVFAGRFVSGRNPVCITLELVLEEWIVEEQHAA